jgi:CitB family two-component system response regulator MalR
MIRVLIVEDDPMVAEMNKFYTEQTPGFRVDGWASTVEEALSMMEKETYDLLLLDIYMPGSTGLELLSQIRNRSLTTDVIVISAAKDTASIRQALHNGAVDYLIKPFEFNRLRAALETYRDRAKLFRSSEVIVQSELDSLTHPAPGNTQNTPLPKGFTRQTLQTIWKAISGLSNEWFASEELSAATGISRVSTGKYLTELEARGILEMDHVYGAVGRPVQKYRVTPQGHQEIKKYL